MTPIDVDARAVHEAAYRLSQTDDGRLVIAALRQMYGHETRTTAVQTTTGSLDPLYTLHLEGQRVVVMRLLEWIRKGSMPQVEPQKEAIR
jgi:hypothetical protein